MSRLAATTATRGLDVTSEPGLRGADGSPHDRRPRRSRRPRRMLDRKRRIEEALAPQLEREERPELEPDITPALVQPQELFEVGDVEQAAAPTAVRNQQIARKARQLAS